MNRFEFEGNEMMGSTSDNELSAQQEEKIKAIFDNALREEVWVSLNEEYEERLIKSLDKYMLIQENIKLKNKIEILENDLQRYEEAESEEEFE